jgi:hypothetical protein
VSELLSYAETLGGSGVLNLRVRMWLALRTPGIDLPEHAGAKLAIEAILVAIVLRWLAW